MNGEATPGNAGQLPHFQRDLFGGAEPITAIGTGFIGGKASGLVRARDALAAGFPDLEFRGIKLKIPAMAVLATDIFDAFIAKNDLDEAMSGGQSDDRIAHAFLKTDFPMQVLGDLRALIEKARAPLAIRSSSLLEDAMHEPFAGVYGTKMIPNHQPDSDTRFKKLIEAIRFVYASTYFREARGYRSLAGRDRIEEKMAVILQEVAGLRYGDRFYPAISGVARSLNYYPVKPAHPEQGVIDLALGLGKTIVDGDACWTYSPAHPNADPPFTISDLLKQTQTRFWAVNMGKPPAYDPMTETEYLIRAELTDAEYDGTLRFVASTYDPASDRVVMGIGRDGPRVLNFAPTVRMPDIPLNALLRELLVRSEDALGSGVEIEFALTIDPLKRMPPTFGFLQVRPIVELGEGATLTEEDLRADGLLAASDRALGHGVSSDLTDVIYVRPDVFRKEDTPVIASEIDRLNRALKDEGRYCLLITFGRLGSSDPWLGVPVDWGQISQAKAIVEATLPEMDVELSQGSHFFHNLTSLKLAYLNVHHAGPFAIDFDWLDRQPVGMEFEHVRHVRLERPLQVHMDGLHMRGVIAR
jgi:Pyruvate phosphate dikinase, AMP/ATP-binding domain